MSAGTRAADQDARGTRDQRRRRRERERSTDAPVPEPRELVSGAGQPLDPGVRRELEEQYGHDLGHVRLHTDRDADALTGLLGADAVAVGGDVFFRAGAPHPGTGPGRHLLAHEVLHTVQDPHGLGTLRAGRAPGAVSLPHQPAEREAEAAAAGGAQSVGTGDAAAATGHTSDTGVAPGAHQTPGWLRYATVDADRARTEHLDPATLTDRLAGGILRSLRGDPADHSGRVRRQLARMPQTVRDLVLDDLDTRLPTHQWNRLLELAEEEAGRLPLEDHTSDVPWAVPDVGETLARQHEDAPAPAEERETAEDGVHRDTESRDAASADPAGATSATAAGTATPEQAGAGEGATSEEGQRQAEIRADDAQQAGAEEASEERDTEEEQRDAEDQAVRDAESEAAEEDREEAPEREAEADEGAERDAAADGRDDDRAPDAETDAEEPGPDDQPLGLDPGAEHHLGDTLDDATALDDEENTASAWHTELQPDDFLPDEDLDLTGVPTADQLAVGADSEPPVPTFPEPPATRAEQVEAEREKEAVDDPAADAESEAEERADAAADEEQQAAPADSGQDPETERTARDLRTERPLDQEIGPDPEHDEPSEPDAESVRRADSAPDVASTDDEETHTEPADGGPDHQAAAQDTGTPVGGAASTAADSVPDRPATAPPVPDRAHTAPERATALGGEGTARLGVDETETTQPESPAEPDVDATASPPAATPQPMDGTPGGPAGTALVNGARSAGDSHAEGAAPATAPAVEATEPTATATAAEPESPGGAAEEDHAAAPAGATRAATAGPSGGGGGGGDAGDAAPRAERAPDLAGLDPEAGLAAAAELKPHSALAAMNGVESAVATDVGAQEQALQDAPPSAERPAGAPQTLHGEPESAPPGEYGDGEVAESDAPETEDAEVENSEEPDGDFAVDDFELSTSDKILAGGAQIVSGAVNGVSNFLGGGDVIDTDAVVNRILDLPTADEAMEQAQVGTAPDVEMGEETGDASQEQTAALDETDAELHQQGVEDTRQPMGEDQIYPDVPQETLRGSVPGGQQHAEEGGSGAPASWEAPAEAVSEVAEHEQPGELRAAFQDGRHGMAEEREAKDTGFRESQHEHEQRVQDGIEENSRAQREERVRTQAEVADSREEWREEQDRELEEIDEEKGDEHEAVLEEVEEREQETDEEVEEQEEADEEAIQEENEEGVEEATEERNREAENSGNWLSDAVDKIVEMFERIKETIKDILEAARERVTAIIREFARVVTELIDAARQWITDRFREFVQALVDLAQRFVRALRELASRIRDLIVRIRDAAIALVNQLATALRDLVTGLLDAVAATLGRLLAALTRGLRMAVEAVTTAVSAVMDFAMGLLNALGEWMDIAVDILRDPGGWLGNAASSAETGAREHLMDEARSEIKQWFNQKIQDILGLPQATFDLLLNGGMTREEIVEEAWAAVLPQLPLIIGELVITKVVARLIPGPGWALAVVEALRAAFGALSEILRAFGLFMTYLKAVPGGSAAQPFAASVAAGIVALLEMVYQLLLSGVARYVERVGSRLRGVAKGLNDRSPDQPDTAERRDQGAEVNEANRETDRAEAELGGSGPPTTAPGTTSTGGTRSDTAGTATTSGAGGGPSPGGTSTTTTKSRNGTGSGSSPGGSSGSPSGAAPRRRTGAARDTVRGPDRGTPGAARRADGKSDTGAPSRRTENDTDGGSPDRSGHRDGGTGQRTSGNDGPGRGRREVDGPKRTPHRPRESAAGASQRRARQTVRAALSRNRRARRALGRRNRNSPLARAMRARSARLRTAYRNRRAQLRRQQQLRHQQRQQRRDQRQKKERSPESKAARLRRIVARIRPRVDRMLGRGVPRAVLRAALRGMRLFYRLSRLDDQGGQRFSILARLNPQAEVAPGLTMSMLDLAEALDDMARRLQQLELGHQRTTPLRQGDGGSRPHRDVPAGTSSFALATDLRSNPKIPQRAEQLVNFMPEGIPLGLRGGRGQYPGNILAHNFSTEDDKLKGGPTYPQLSKSPMRRDPQRAGQLAKDLMTGQRNADAWQGSGSKKDQTFQARAAMSGLLLGGVEPARLQSSFIPNLMAASLGAQGATNFAEHLPDLPMSPKKRVAHGRQQEFTVAARRILQAAPDSGPVPMPLLSGRTPPGPISGVSDPQVNQLRSLAYGLNIDNAQARRSLGVDMRQGNEEQTWSAVQRSAADGSLTPTLQGGSESLMRAKVQVVRAWAGNQKMSFRDERTKKEKEREFLDRIWRWLLSELDLSDGGKGF